MPRTELRKWSHSPNGEEYQLVVKETTTKKEVIFKIKITGGFSYSDPGQIDKSKTYIQPTKITLTAGVEGSVQLELKTTGGNLKNFCYKKVEENISVKFPDKVKDCQYTLVQDEKPDQYKIKYTFTIKGDAIQNHCNYRRKRINSKS